MTGAELKAWREQFGLSPLDASEALSIEPWQLAAYERGQIPIPPYIERLVADLTKHKTED